MYSPKGLPPWEAWVDLYIPCSCDIWLYRPTPSMVFIGSRGLTTHVEISTCVREDIIFYRQMCSICKVSLTITVCQVGLNTKCYLSKTTWEGIRVAVEELLLNSPPDEIFALLNKCTRSWCFAITHTISRADSQRWNYPSMQNVNYHDKQSKNVPGLTCAFSSPRLEST